MVTYGAHVSRYVEAHRGGRGNVFVAPQAVDVRALRGARGATPSGRPRASAAGGTGRRAAGAVRRAPGAREGSAGAAGCLADGRALGPGARLALAGPGPLEPEVAGAGKASGASGTLPPPHLPALYAAADVLVLPSVRTATFVEPWGLVVNEAMLQSTPVIASDAVGAVAGGLVRDGRNGLVFPAGDAAALAARLQTLAARAGAAGCEWAPPPARTPPHSRPPAWAEGVREGVGRRVSG